MLTTGKHEIAINTSTPFYTADGYKTDSKISNSSKYLGDKNRFALRYHYKYNDELQFGITTEKDAGEPFACREFSDRFLLRVFLPQTKERTLCLHIRRLQD